MPVKAILDACVLIPAALRDTLLRTSHANLYSMRLSDDIMEEVCRNLIKEKMASEESANRLISIITTNFRGSFVENYRQYIPLMPINQHDRHILAAADYIVTQNLRDFPSKILKCFRIEAVSPDRFLMDLFHAHPEIVASVLIDQAHNLRKPPKTVFEILDGLAVNVPKFSMRAKNYIKSIKPDEWYEIKQHIKITEAKNDT